ncbi:GDSL-type esterase/lipase family protein [Streptomyces sp. NPDC000594]|uniref:GDSL-type esterase/lipase family protein n=1 Tax=Streptomyces sp. NPDC000594 TaxID=3154261 RepID=UPI0033262B0C
MGGLATVIALPAPASALPQPENTWVATQNMQGRGEVWSSTIRALAENNHVVALQEVPHDVDPVQGWIPRPPAAAPGAFTQLSRSVGSGLPALPAGVGEYHWRTGTAFRGIDVYVYALRTTNHPVAVITRTRAWGALNVQSAGSSRNALVVLDRDHEMAYASFHASAYDNNPAPAMVDAIAQAVGNEGPGWRWAVIGDFNREPDGMRNNRQIRDLGAAVFEPVDADGRQLPTQISGRTLDYMVTNDPNDNWSRVRTSWGSSADHATVYFGNAQGGAEPVEQPVVIQNNQNGTALTENGLTRNPILTDFTHEPAQIFNQRNHRWIGGMRYFELESMGIPGCLGSGNQMVGVTPCAGPARAGTGASSSAGAQSETFLWRVDGNTLRNVHGQRLTVAKSGGLWMHKPEPTEPENDSWSIYKVSPEHRSTAGFPVGTEKSIALSNDDTHRFLQDDRFAATEGRSNQYESNQNEKWVLRPSRSPGSMYLVNRSTEACLTAQPVSLFPLSALTKPCPTAATPDSEVRLMSWQYVGEHIRNVVSGRHLGHATDTSPVQGTGFTVARGHTTRFDVANAPDKTELRRLAVMPLGDSITLGVGSGARTGYRPALARMLAQDAPDVQFVGSMRDADGTRHEGHSGWRIDQISANVERWMADSKPNLVLLHIGTNDMNRNHQVDTAPQRLAGLIDQIHTSSPRTAIVVASLVPAADRTVQARVNAYNRAIPGIVADRAQRGYRITQVSMGTLTVADLDDHLHPNDNGYRKMAGAFHGGIADAAGKKWIDDNVTVKPAPPGTGSPTVAGDHHTDINGDGRSDYLVVQDNGAVRAWTSSTAADGTVKWADHGTIAAGSSAWSGDQVRFADIGGDSRADYLVLGANGSVRAFVNTGGDGRGGWRDIGTIAAGSAAWNSGQVRFADIGGDAKADYLIVSERGGVRAFIHTTAADGTVKWNDQGTVATGSARWTAEDVRFADIAGDAKADYLIVSDNGAVQGYTNTTTANGTLKWYYQGYVATGSTQWTGAQVRFADVIGDTKADYLTLAPDGALTAYERTTGPEESVRWTNRGVIATGTGHPASRVRI